MVRRGRWERPQLSPSSSFSSPHWCIPRGPLPERPLALEAPHEALGVLKELAHGGAKGGHRLTVGIGDPLFGGGADAGWRRRAAGPSRARGRPPSVTLPPPAARGARPCRSRPHRGRRAFGVM